MIALAGIVSASLFYAQKSKKADVAGMIKTVENKSETVATFPVSGNKIKILFVGDMMFDRWIRQVSEKRGGDFVFQKIEPLLKSEDLVVGNLEGPITDKTSVSVDSEFGSKENYVFTFPPQTAEELFKENIKLVNLGNNHILNQGDDGLSNTKNYLQTSGVGFFGDPEEQSSRVKIFEAGGLKIAFINYNQFVADAKQKTLDDINSAKTNKTDVIILYTHWGKEFIPMPEEKIKILAHEFVDAGADLIIGSHPHVIQTKEEHKGKMIYYSLGNFIFDQYFSPETQVGLGVEIQIDPMSKKIDFKEDNFTMTKSGQTILK